MSRMSLGNVKSGKIECPLRVLLYGIHGVGKTVFAASAPAPIFLSTEDGTAHVDVARFPEPQSFEEVLEAVAELREGKHDFRTLVIDTIDWLEPLVFQHVMKTWRPPGFKGEVRKIDDYGYYKGQVAAVDSWRLLLSQLEAMQRERSMHLIMLAHSHIANFKNPDGEDYQRYTLAMDARGAGTIKQWCEAILFAQHETFTHEQDHRTKGVDSGKRVIYTQYRAAWDAKNRYGLPPKLPLEWREFESAWQSGEVATIQALRAEFDALLPELDEETRAKAQQYFAKDGSSQERLPKLLDWMRGKVQ